MSRYCLCLLVILNAVAPASGAMPKPAVTALAVAPDGDSFVHGSQAGVRGRSLRDDSEQPLGTRLEQVCALAFSDDGTCLAVAGGSPGESGIVEVCTWPERKRIISLEGHDDVVHAVAWLSPGRKLASASADRRVRVWDVRSGKCLATLAGHSGPVLALAASSDGKWLCSGGVDHTIRVWSTADPKLVRVLSNHLSPVHALAFRPQKEGMLPCLASAGDDDSVRIWQPSIGRMVRIIRHPAPVVALAWSKDGAHLWTGARDGSLRQVDGDSDAILQTCHLTGGRISSLALRPRDSLRIIGHGAGAISRSDKAR
jgi:WD40 repeat protein